MSAAPHFNVTLTISLHVNSCVQENNITSSQVKLLSERKVWAVRYGLYPSRFVLNNQIKFLTKFWSCCWNRIGFYYPKIARCSPYLKAFIRWTTKFSTFEITNCLVQDSPTPYSFIIHITNMLKSELSSRKHKQSFKIPKVPRATNSSGGGGGGRGKGLYDSGSRSKQEINMSVDSQ